MTASIYIGKPCKRGGHTERYSSNGNCTKCALLSSQFKYLYNAERACEQSRIWHHANREKILVRQHAYSIEHKDEMLANSRLYAANNRKKNADNSRKWRADNPGRGAAMVRDWLRRNPLKVREYTHARIARKTGAPGRYTADDVLQLFTQQNGRCQYCCALLGTKWQVDHIYPLSRGGTNFPSNICLACIQCNRGKGTNSSETFAMRLLGASSGQPI